MISKKYLLQVTLHEQVTYVKSIPSFTMSELYLLNKYRLNQDFLFRSVKSNHVSL